MSLNILESAHAPLSPSSGSIWLNCSGSYGLFWKEKDTSSEAARQGTLYHKLVLEDIIRDGKPEEEVLKEAHDEEMKEYVLQTVSFIRAIRAKFPQAKEYIEKKVQLTQNIWGTLDYALVTKNSAFILDLKYGFWPVEVRGNIQTRIYLMALENTLEAKFKKGNICIYQPRIAQANPYSLETLERKEMLEFKKMILKAEKLALSMPEDYTPGDHCKWCKAKYKCPALTAEVKQECIALLPDDPEKKPELHRVETEKLVDLYRKFDRVKLFMKAVEGHLQKRLMDGEAINGLKLVRGRKTREWKYSGDVLLAHLKEIGIQEVYDKKIIGIPAAEKVLGKGNPHINKLLNIKRTLQIAEESDKREAVDLNATEENLKLLDN